MGGFCTQSTTTLPDPKSVLSGTQIPEWVSAAGQQLYTQSAEMAASPFPEYTGQRIATYGDMLDADGNRIQTGTTKTEAPSFTDAQNFYDYTVVNSDAFKNSDKPLFTSPRITPAVEGYQPPPMTLSDITPEARQMMVDAGFSFDAPEGQPIYARNKLTPEEIAAGELLSQGSDTYQSYLDDAAAMSATLGQGYDATSTEDLLGSDFEGLSREDLMGQYQGMSREDLIGQGIQPFSMDSAQPYLDIYQGAQDTAVDEVRRQTEMANRQNRANAATSGAFGGSRLGIQEGVTAGEGARAAGDLRARAAQEGLSFAANRYDANAAQSERDRAARFGAENLARGQFGEDRQARLGVEDRMRSQFDVDRQARFGAEDAKRAAFETQEAGRLRASENLQGYAPLVQGLTEQAASGLLTAGQARRQLDQMALDLAYSDYVEQREYPFQMANFALGALQGVPYETRTIGLEQGQQYVQNPSIYGQTIGGLGSLASAYYMRNN
tara:strand:- start:411 stop:1895 length:1485 start_codon:yes stop_codon:yes gene_type:complete